MVKRDRDRPTAGIDRGSSQRGRARVAERAVYLALVNEGVGYREAARRAGVNYRLTKQWRAVQRPVAPEPALREISARYPHQDERIVIADRVRDNASIRSIARELGRPACTVSREIRRHRHPDGTYRPYAAPQRAAARRTRPPTEHAGHRPRVAGVRPGWAGPAVEPTADRPTAAPRAS
jgi:IS30 family transposase